MNEGQNQTLVGFQDVLQKLRDVMQNHRLTCLSGGVGTGKTEVLRALTASQGIYVDCQDASSHGEIYERLRSVLGLSYQNGEPSEALFQRCKDAAVGRLLVFDHLSQIDLAEQMSLNTRVVASGSFEPERCGAIVLMRPMNPEESQAMFLSLLEQRQLRFTEDHQPLLDLGAGHPASLTLIADQALFASISEIQAFWEQATDDRVNRVIAARLNSISEPLRHLVGGATLFVEPFSVQQFQLALGQLFEPQLFQTAMQQRWLEKSQNGWSVPRYHRNSLEETDIQVQKALSAQGFELIESLYSDTPKIDQLRAKASASKGLSPTSRMETRVWALVFRFHARRIEGNLVGLGPELESLDASMLDERLYLEWVLAYGECLMTSGRHDEANRFLSKFNLRLQASTTHHKIRGRLLLACALESKSSDVALEKINVAESESGTHSGLRGLCLERRGFVHLRRGELRAAQDAFEMARRMLEKGFPDAAISGLATTLFLMGRMSDARDLFRQLRDGVNNEDHRYAELEFNLGVMCHHLADLDEAQGCYEHALGIWKDAHMPRHVALVCEKLALLHFERNRPKMAREAAYDCLAIARQTGATERENLVRGWMAVFDLVEGDVARARGALEALENRTQHQDVESYLVLKMIHALCLEGEVTEVLTFAKGLKATVNEDQQALIQIADFVETSIMETQIRSKAHRLEIRVALRCASWVTTTQTSRESLVVHPDGLWFRTNEETVDLSTRRPLRRLLAFLVSSHQTDPSRGHSVQDLVSVGWPDEKLTRSSGANRVYTAIRFLRELGLDEYLITRKGYRIREDVQVVMED